MDGKTSPHPCPPVKRTRSPRPRRGPPGAPAAPRRSWTETAAGATLSICTIKVVHDLSSRLFFLAGTMWAERCGRKVAAAGAHAPQVGGTAIFGRCPCMGWEPGGPTLAGGRAAPGLPLWPGMAPWLRVPAHARWVKIAAPVPEPGDSWVESVAARRSFRVGQRSLLPQTRTDADA